MFPALRSRLSAVVMTAVLAGMAVPLGADGPRPIAETDLTKFVWIADPQISPDGAAVVYTRVTVNGKEDGYDTDLWLVPADASQPARRLTAGPRDTSPRWSPDGRAIAFVRSPVGGDGPSAPQIHLLSLDGGEARPLTSLARGASTPAWSPDGRTIAFTSTTEAGKDEEKAGETKSDVRVITRAVYRANGGGYLDPTRHSHVWTVAVPGPAEPPVGAKQITSGEFSEGNVRWSPDGARLYFTSSHVKEPYYEQGRTDLYMVPAAGGEATKLVTFDGGMRRYAFSPDGRSIAFTGAANHEPERSYDQSDLWVVENRAGATPRNLTAGYDFPVGGGIGSDQHAPRGSQPGEPVWSADGRALYAVTAEHGRSNLVRVDAASGAVTPVTAGDHDLISYTASANASRFVTLVSTTTEIGDLFAFDAAAPARQTRLTRVNEALFGGLRLTPPETFWYTSFDGARIQGWIQKPPDFDPSHKYPMILEIHGGPHSAYGFSFFHEIQWMAAKGYVVLYVNPRGSTSYGQDFGNVIQYHYPGDDYKDLMAGVNELVKRGYIDPRRLGVTGGSGGGLLTNWVVTQTTRFAAAVSQRSIADWAGFWYTADFTLFTPSWFRGAPWEDPKDFAARSPITHIANVKTPLMLIVGDVDYRTPEGDGGEQMFRALKYMKVPTVMVQFPGESHELSRSGRPAHRVERLQHIVAWFDKYLQGKDVETYDVRN